MSDHRSISLKLSSSAMKGSGSEDTISAAILALEILIASYHSQKEKKTLQSGNNTASIRHNDRLFGEDTMYLNEIKFSHKFRMTRHVSLAILGVPAVHLLRDNLMVLHSSEG